MRPFPIILLFSLCFLSVCPTEDCTNAIDDDGDGLIDLNDPECSCSPKTQEPEEELIFNGGFELIDLSRPECQGCISLYDGDGCPQGWLQTSVNLHSPCFTDFNPSINIGYLTSVNNYQGVGGSARQNGAQLTQKEFLQTSLTSPLTAGRSYQFSGKFDLPTATQSGINLSASHRIVLLGSNDSEALNSQGNIGDCYEDRPGWHTLAYLDFENNPNDNLIPYTISFTAPASYSILAIASACCQPSSPPDEALSYYGVDDLSLRPATSEPLRNQLLVNSSGCDVPVVVCVSDPGGLNIQWYREGIAIIDAQSSCLVLPADTPNGTNIQAWITSQDNCVILDTVINRACIFPTEICDNGIDDDGDGLIDINDPDCICQDSSLFLSTNENYCPTAITLALQTGLSGQIQWYADGIALAGENNHELILGPTASLNTNYRALVFDSTGICFSTPVFQPTLPDELQFIWTNKVARCYGDSNACLTAEPIMQIPLPYDYSWLDTAGNILSQSTQLNNITAGNYSLIVVTPGGCTGSYSFTVNQPEQLTIFPIINELVCPVENTGGLLRLVTNDATSPLEHCYFDSQNNLADCSFENTFSFPPGIYIGTSTNNEGCTVDWGPLEINAPEIPAITISASAELISLGENLTARLNGETDQLSLFQWRPAEIFDCIDCLVTTARPLSPQTIYLDYEFGQAGCTYTDSIFITVAINHDLFIPNAFSPNFDGINDCWKVFPGPAVAGISTTTIYDRWGETVFKSTDNNGWTGISTENKPFPTGIYLYQLEITFIDGSQKTFAGDLLLTR